MFYIIYKYNLYINLVVERSDRVPQAKDLDSKTRLVNCALRVACPTVDIRILHI